MQPWSGALSACSGAWDALWLMKREGQGEGGARGEPQERESGQTRGCECEIWDDVSHRLWKICPREAKAANMLISSSEWTSVYGACKGLIECFGADESFYLESYILPLDWKLHPAHPRTTQGKQDIAVSQKRDFWLEPKFAHVAEHMERFHNERN